jgi:hypothetical protein
MPISASKYPIKWNFFFPNRSAFNYVIAAIEVADGLILLDATDHFLHKYIAFACLNWED